MITIGKNPDINRDMKEMDGLESLRPGKRMDSALWPTGSGSLENALHPAFQPSLTYLMLTLFYFLIVIMRRVRRVAFLHHLVLFRAYLRQISDKSNQGPDLVV